MEVVTSFEMLMKLAGEVGKARQFGNEEELEIAIQKHEDYKQMCLKSDRICLGMTVGELDCLVAGHKNENI